MFVNCFYDYLSCAVCKGPSKCSYFVPTQLLRLGSYHKNFKSNKSISISYPAIMDKAKAAVSNFTSKHDHRDTTVDESTSRPVNREHIKPTRNEEAQEAVDREVHQDHHHTTVQPIQHQEVLPEQHYHQMRDVTHKQFEHGDQHVTRSRLEQEAAQFKDSSKTHETRRTTAAAPRVEGEHTHHHVHETVQPVIHKETIAPEVVHTTVPIHETHHAGAQNHGISVLPMKTVDEVESSGSGILSGKSKVRHEEYEGKPRPYNKDLEMTAEKVMHPHGHHSTGTTEQRGI
jgi:hypothetical protein